MHLGSHSALAVTDLKARSPLEQRSPMVGIQSWDRVKGTKATRVIERIRVSLGVIFSRTVSCCGAWAGPRGMTSRAPTLICSISDWRNTVKCGRHDHGVERTTLRPSEITI